MLAVETAPLAQILSRAASAGADFAESPRGMVDARPARPGCPFVVWTAAAGRPIPSAVIPDSAKLFQLWLARHAGAAASEINRLVVLRLYEWLTRIEEAQAADSRDRYPRGPRIRPRFRHMSTTCTQTSG